MPLRKPTPEELQHFADQGVDVSTLPEQLDFDDGHGDMSKMEAAKATLRAHKGGILAGGAGALGTGAILGGIGLAPFTGGLSAIPSIAGLIGIAGAGAAAGYGGQKLQEKLEGEEVTKRLQEEASRAQQEHPIVSAATDISASALASGGFPSIATPVRAASGVLKSLAQKGASEIEKKALQSVALNAALNPAINTGINAAVTGELPSGKDVLEQVAGGALFAGHNPLLGKLNILKEPASEPTTKPTETVITKEPTENVKPQEVTTPFTEKGPDGKYVIADEFVKKEFSKQNPRPDITGLNDVDKYKVMTQYKQGLKMSLADMRAKLHEGFLAKQDELSKVAASEQKPEVTPEPTTKPVEIVVETEKPIEWKPKFKEPTYEDEKWKPAEETSIEPAGDNAPVPYAESVKPVIKPTINEPLKPGVQPVIDKGQPQPITNPDSQLAASANRDELLGKLGVDDKKYYPSQDEYKKQLNADKIELESIKSQITDRIKNSLPIDDLAAKRNSILDKYGGTPYKKGKLPEVGLNDNILNHFKIAVEQGEKGFSDKQILDVLTQNLVKEHPENLEKIATSQTVDEALNKFGLEKVGGKGTKFHPDVVLKGERPTYYDEINSPQQKGDYERYNEIQERMGQLIKDESLGDEFHKLWAESEKIKNKNGGMPPTKNTNVSGGDMEDDYLKRVEHNYPQFLTGEPHRNGQELKTVNWVKKNIDKLYNPNDPYVKLIKELKLDTNSLNTTIWQHKQVTRASYSLRQDRIMLSEHESPLVIAHEIIHAATSRKLPVEFEGKRGYKLKEALDHYVVTGKNESIKEIIKCYLETAKLLGMEKELFETNSGEQRADGAINGYAGVHPDVTQREIRLHGYEMGDLHEFLAGVFTREEFQYHLNELPSGENKTIWSRLVDAIRQLFGLPVKDGSMLERVLKPTESLMEQSRGRESLQNKGGGYRLEAQAPNIVNKAFGPMIDKIREIDHPSAGKVADALHSVLVQKQHYIGQQLNPILEKGAGMSAAQDSRLEAAARYERETSNAAPTSMFRTLKERETFNQAKASLKANFLERFNNQEPVYRNGQPTMPRRDEFYWPTTTNPKIAEVYRANSDATEIAKLDKQFLDYQNKLDISSADAQDNLLHWKEGIQSSASKSDAVGNQKFFNAARRSQGIPLPPEFTRPGFLKNLEAYFHRQATDNAHYKFVESNPDVMSALGEKIDAWHHPIPVDPSGGIAGNPQVRAQLNEIKGHLGGAGYYNEKALSSLATTLFIGPGTTIHKALSNFVGMTNYADNPIQLGRMLTGMITNAKAGLEHATENGVVKLSARTFRDVLNSQLSAAERLQALAKTVRGVYSLGDLTDKWGSGLIQAGLESVMPTKISRANNGDKTQQQLLKRIDPSYTVGKVYTTSEMSKLSSELVASIHGTGDGRTMPSWMAGDTELSGFFRLSNWGISQTNRFMSDIWKPATQGNVTPLLTSMFGSAIGGYLIKELREKLQGKKGQIPSLSEIADSSRGVEGNIPLVAYNVMAALSYAGFGGMITQIGKVPFDWVHKNTAQGATFPLDEAASDLAKTLGQVSTAIANDPKVDWVRLSGHVLAHLMQTNFQLGRVAYNQAIDSGLLTEVGGDVGQSLAEKKKLSDKMGQLRRFEMVEGLPFQEQDQNGNPYMNLEQKRFKQTQDPQQAMKELPGLIASIMDKYKDHPDVMISKIEALKQNSYATMPSMETTPISFMKYLGYLDKQEGPEKAHEALIDFMRHKAMNEAKASVVP